MTHFSPPPPPDSRSSDPSRPDLVLQALWDRVTSAWDDDKAHTALLDHALRAQSLPELAGRYRSLVSDPTRGPLAKKRLDVIVIAATESLWSMKTPKPGKVPLSITLSAFGVCAFLLGWLAWVLAGHR